MTTGVRPGSGVALVRSIGKLLGWRRRRRRRVGVCAARKREEIRKGMRSRCDWSVDELVDGLAAAVVLVHLVGPGDESALGCAGG